MTTNSQDTPKTLDGFAKLMANRIGSPYGEGATYDHRQAIPESESDQYKANGKLHSHLYDEDFELFVSDFKEWVNAYISKELKAVIGDDEKHHNGQKMVNDPADCMDCTNPDERWCRNQFRTEQRQRAKAKGYDV